MQPAPNGGSRNFSLLLPVLLLLVIQLLPIWMILLTSFKSPIGMLQDFPLFSLQHLGLDNYYRVLVTDQFGHYLWTSALVAFSSTGIALAAGSLAAHALTRYPFPAKKSFIMMVLCARMLPPVAVAVPVFLLLKSLGLLDHLFGLIIAHSTFNLPLAIWMLLPFFSGIPQEIGDAIAMDGASPITAFRLVYLPLIRPALAVTAVFCFLMSWNDFLFSLILAGSSTKTAPLAINSYMTADQIEWGPMAASATVVMIPVFIFSIILQRHRFHGLSGSLKG